YGGFDLAQKLEAWRYALGGLAGLLALLAWLVASAGIVAYVAFRYATRRLPKNFYGICSGGDRGLDARYRSADPKPLGHRMAETIDELAGRGKTAGQP